MVLKRGNSRGSQSNQAKKKVEEKHSKTKCLPACAKSQHGHEKHATFFHNRRDSESSLTTSSRNSSVSEPFPTDELIGEIIHTITVEQPIKPFLFPEEGLMFVPAANDLHQKFANGDSERKIHNNTALNAQERAQINEFMQYIARHNIHLGPFVLSSASRFISRARGDIAKAVKLMENSIFCDRREQKIEFFG